MALIRKLFELYVFSSLHVALAVSALLLVSGVQLDLEISDQLLLFVFFSTAFSYNLIKYGLRLDRVQRDYTYLKPGIRVVTIASGLLAVAFAFYVFSSVWLVLIPSVLLTFLYGFPLRGKQTLRSLGWIKVLIVSLVWSIVTVLLPWAESQRPVETALLIIFAQRFLAVSILTIPFEIRDMDFDDRALGTLPQRFGVRGVKVLGTILAILYLVLEIIPKQSSMGNHLASVAFVLFALLLMWLANRTRSVFYAAFWVEGLPFFWLLMLFLFRSYG